MTRSFIMRVMMTLLFLFLTVSCQLTEDLRNMLMNRGEYNASNPIPVWSTVCPQAPFEGRDNHSLASFKGSIWMIGGRAPWPKSDIWTSPNGIQWSMVTDQSPFSNEPVILEYRNTLWAIDGSSVWNSPDGTNWHFVSSNLAFADRYDFSAVVFHDAIWIMGGCRISDGAFTNDVWLTTDGTNWQNAYANYGVKKCGTGAVVFKDAIWVIGGFYDLGIAFPLSRVQASSDGTNWISIPDAPFRGRYDHAVVTASNRMWVIGGYAGDEFLQVKTNDIWYTSDGTNWTEIQAYSEIGKVEKWDIVSLGNTLWAVTFIPTPPVGGSNRIWKKN